MKIPDRCLWLNLGTDRSQTGQNGLHYHYNDVLQVGDIHVTLALNEVFVADLTDLQFDCHLELLSNRLYQHKWQLASETVDQDNLLSVLLYHVMLQMLQTLAIACCSDVSSK